MKSKCWVVMCGPERKVLKSLSNTLFPQKNVSSSQRFSGPWVFVWKFRTLCFCRSGEKPNYHRHSQARWHKHDIASTRGDWSWGGYGWPKRTGSNLRHYMKLLWLNSSWCVFCVVDGFGVGVLWIVWVLMALVGLMLVLYIHQKCFLCSWIFCSLSHAVPSQKSSVSLLLLLLLLILIIIVVIRAGRV